MDGPQTIPRLPQLLRLSEQTRLHGLWMAQAYERLCPIRRLSLPCDARSEVSTNRKPFTPPRVAAGG